ncbi:MAG: hypothetical protein VW891_18505, partial [Novosphingobium sp.]
MKIIGDVEGDVDILASSLAQQLACALKDRSDLLQAHFQRAFSGEGQQLCGEGAGTIRSGQGIGEIAGGWRLFGHCPHCTFDVASDDKQEIVEIMRDPSGQLAEGFHLLSLPQLFFGMRAGFGFPDEFGVEALQFGWGGHGKNFGHNRPYEDRGRYRDYCGEGLCHTLEAISRHPQHK